MSRSERRAYKRLTKNQDPYALPAATRGRPPRQRGRRERRSGEFRFLSGRFLVWALGGGLAVSLLAFSIAWPNGMPFALYVGLAAGAVWLLLTWLVRSVQARSAAKR